MTFNIKDYDEEDQARMEEFGKWKTCSKCGEVKPRSWTEFRRGKRYKEGIKGQCKVCTTEYDKDYHKDNKEAIADYSAEYRKGNKEAIADYNAEYRKENKEAIADYMEEYQRNNPEIKRRIAQRRRARLAELPHTLTIEEWEESLAHFNDSCGYCGVHQDDLEHTLHQEHVIPVAKGGGYIVENIIPSCGACNASKNTRDMEEWYREQPFFTGAQLHKIKEWQKDSE